MGEKLQMKKEILRESGKEERQIVGIRKKEISFSGWSRRCCPSGNQAHTITFLSQSTHQATPMPHSQFLRFCLPRRTQNQVTFLTVATHLLMAHYHLIDRNKMEEAFISI